MKICEFIVSTILFLLALPFILALLLLVALREISDKIFRMIALVFITIIYSLVGFKDLLFKTNNIEKLNELLKTYLKKDNFWVTLK